eukprot:Awhi_evm1s13656
MESRVSNSNVLLEDASKKKAMHSDTLQNSIMGNSNAKDNETTKTVEQESDNSFKTTGQEEVSIEAEIGDVTNNDEVDKNDFDRVNSSNIRNDVITSSFEPDVNNNTSPERSTTSSDPNNISPNLNLDKGNNNIADNDESPNESQNKDSNLGKKDDIAYANILEEKEKNSSIEAKICVSLSSKVNSDHVATKDDDDEDLNKVDDDDVNDAKEASFDHVITKKGAVDGKRASELGNEDNVSDFEKEKNSNLQVPPATKTAIKAIVDNDAVKDNVHVSDTIIAESKKDSLIESTSSTIQDAKDTDLPQPTKANPEDHNEKEATPEVHSEKEPLLDTGTAKVPTGAPDKPHTDDSKNGLHPIVDKTSMTNSVINASPSNTISSSAKDNMSPEELEAMDILQDFLETSDLFCKDHEMEDCGMFNTENGNVEEEEEEEEEETYYNVTTERKLDSKNLENDDNNQIDTVSENNSKTQIDLIEKIPVPISTVGNSNPTIRKTLTSNQATSEGFTSSASSASTSSSYRSLPLQEESYYNVPTAGILDSPLMKERLTLYAKKKEINDKDKTMVVPNDSREIKEADDNDKDKNMIVPNDSCKVKKEKGDVKDKTLVVPNDSLEVKEAGDDDKDKTMVVPNDSREIKEADDNDKDKTKIVPNDSCKVKEANGDVKDETLVVPNDNLEVKEANSDDKDKTMVVPNDHCEDKEADDGKKDKTTVVPNDSGEVKEAEDDDKDATNYKDQECDKANVDDSTALDEQASKPSLCDGDNKNDSNSSTSGGSTLSSALNRFLKAVPFGLSAFSSSTPPKVSVATATENLKKKDDIRLTTSTTIDVV